MIELGCFDPASQPLCEAYRKEVEQITRVPFSEIAEGADKLSLRPLDPAGQALMSVAEVQRSLRAIGFFPGGEDDGICGYRTLSAIRLFQEYVRSVEKLECVPDGRFGPQSQRHLRRWLDQGLKPVWAPTIEQWRTGSLGRTEFTDWLTLLQRVKAQQAANPKRILQMVNAFAGKCSTRKVAQWDFSPGGSPQLIGIRRNEFSGKFDDVFVLLIKGLVFKFQGSTEPGATKHPRGAPFLVEGQHDYHFGWHQRKYLALRPLVSVLVVRSKNDKRLDEADLANGLETEPTINIHWGGSGMARDVNEWSEGCQVINGSVYINAGGELVDCSAFAAVRPAEAMDRALHKTRGAYCVLQDLITALASDVPGSTVRYTLVAEQDLGLEPAVGQQLAQARSRVLAMTA
jgi:hypothetical protein